ncbi:MAG TPA: biotin/lipoyl-binding protein, partial [Allosphingosinicella sp.]|nr:biotin/lipoyl-binding protein [Allosphingosinicella sp.]
MNKPASKDQFDIAEIDAALANEREVNAKATRKRKKAFLIFGAIVLKAGLGYFGYGLIAHQGVIETDNAYVGADTASITPLVTGHVARVLVGDAQSVRAGQPLVVLDQTDARLALAEAEAAYDQARRRVSGYVATDRQLAAQISMRGAEEA